MKRLFTFLIITCLIFLQYIVQAQTVYRSIQTGNWSTNTSWEISTNNGVTYNPTTPSQTPGATNDVIIANSNVISLDASGKNSKTINIQSGGTLNSTSGATEKTLRVNGNTLTNNGTLGGNNDITTIEFNTANTTGGFTITGSGTNKISRIRMVSGNTNTPVNTVIVDQDMTLQVGSNGISSNYAFSAFTAASSNDNYVLTINPGKVVTVTGGYWQYNGINSGATTPFGNVTYNINGTLNMSGSTTAGSSTFVGSADATKELVVNINGTVKLPTSGNSALNFSETAATGQLGAVIFNITGLLDASNAPIINTTTTLPPRLFNMTPTGILRRTVGSTATVFPISSGGSNNTVTLTNAGTADNFSVSVKSTIDNAVTIPSVVNRQWTITEGTPGGSDATVSLSWVSADYDADFDPGTIVIGHWNGTKYEIFPATVTGTGAANDPYVATASGITSFSQFIVGNLSALPITFESARAYQKINNVQVEWATAQESNVDKFAIEKSTNGVSFSTIGYVNAIGNTSTKSYYSFLDATPSNGNNFYRIKAIDKDGKLNYSSVLRVAISNAKMAVTIAPNPVSGKQLNIQFVNAVKGSYEASLYNAGGQKVFSSKINTEEGSSTQSITLPSAIKAGAYNLILNSGDVKINKSIIVE